jgi:hypothetical protein
MNSFCALVLTLSLMQLLRRERLNQPGNLRPLPVTQCLFLIVFLTTNSLRSATNSIPCTGELSFLATNHTLTRSACRSQDWTVQNAARVRGDKTWQTLVELAADALICATGGFEGMQQRASAAAASAAAHAPAPALAASRPFCPVHKLPVFAEPFAVLKKSPSSAPSFNVELDSSSLSRFVYNKACKCK